MKKIKKVDRVFLLSVIFLTVTGFFVFSSASLGLLARSGAQFSSVIFNQTFLGLFGGSVATLIVSRIHYKFWRKYAFYIFLGTALLTLLVFVPGLGFEHGGAKRWIILGNFSFQPSEFLKIGFVIYFAAWLSGIKDKIGNFKFGITPFLIILGIVGVILLNQPDTDTFIVIFVAGLAMFIAARAKWSHVAVLTAIAGAGLLSVVLRRQYILDRIMTFLNPASDSLGASYQIQQSLIAIGSGGLFGRGFGQSVQKFTHLPEPTGDSIFAIIGEEFGFLGSSLLIFAFLFFAYRGFKIALKAPDSFGGLMALGIVIMIIFQSFIHIAGLLNVFPLSGSPLLFFSHGGTALFAVLFQIGIILNISRYKRE